MMEARYRYALSFTSQFYYCGLPLRLDSYSRCHFNCLYCFASARGGERGYRSLRTADPAGLRKRLERLTKKGPRSVIEELLLQGQPIHFGGMSDPFIPLEADTHVTLELLRVLADHRYPTVVSTKGALIERDEYIEALKRGRFIVQLSMSSADAKLLARIDLGTPGPSALLRVAGALRTEGIPTALRIQPLFPGRISDAYEVIDAGSSVGIRHAAVEHLKLPIETSWWGTARLSQALGIDLRAYYASKRSRRVGREWVLPVEERLATVVLLREYAHSRGMTFGAADNDLLLLADGDCCCSGIDLLDGFENFFRFNYTEAVRKGASANLISIGALKDSWYPRGSIGQYVNSSSRLAASPLSGASVVDYLRRNWNGSPNGNSPRALFGVLDTGESDETGFRLYTLSDEIRELMKARRRVEVSPVCTRM